MVVLTGENALAEVFDPPASRRTHFLHADPENARCRNDTRGSSREALSRPRSSRKD